MVDVSVNASNRKLSVTGDWSQHDKLCLNLLQPATVSDFLDVFPARWYGRRELPTAYHHHISTAKLRLGRLVGALE